MRIHPSNRVVYEINPIVEVVCQIRFPSLLSIDEFGPSKFQQDFANNHYPLLDIQHDQQISFEFNASQDFSNPPQKIVSKTYHFDNEDRTWRVSIGSSFFAFTCLKYKDWDDFSERFFAAFSAFVTCYPIQLTQRVGLRYKDVIDRTILGIENSRWSELLEPFVIGILSADHLSETEPIPENDIETYFSQSIIKLEECNLLLQSALLADQTKTKTAFLIDGDYYVERINHFNTEEIKEQLNKLHSSAGALFRRCIRTPLHEALRPILPKT